MERIRRTRNPDPPARVTRTRPAAREVPDRFPVKWVQYKTSRCLYIGRHLFGIVSFGDAKHRGGMKWIGNVQIPGCVGPVAYGDSELKVMHEIKHKAMEWLDGLNGEAPAPVSVQEEQKKTRRRR